jgi:hypothetical protein
MTRNHPFEGPEVFDDHFPSTMTDEQVLAELEPYPLTAEAVRQLREIPTWARCSTGEERLPWNQPPGDRLDMTANEGDSQ